jgi:mono/diheme cytochrome c family protein
MIMLGRGVGGWVIPVAVALLGCRDPANDRPSILREAPEVTPAANDNADAAPRAPAAARPLSGGTLLVASDGRTAVSADPDHDRLWITDLTGATPPRAVELGEGADPGRIFEDGRHRVHVVLRGAGEIVTLDLALGLGQGLAASTAQRPSRRAVCTAPRGVAWDPADDAVLVACAGGELVRLPAAGGSPTRRTFVAADLRDVVVSQGYRYLTRFRSAEVIQLDAQDRPVRTTLGGARDGAREASVAWRTQPLPRGGALVLHQVNENLPLRMGPQGFSADLPCGAGVVQSAVSVVKDDSAALTSLPLRGAVLALDLALDPRGEEVAVAAPGGAARGAQVLRYRFDRLYSNVEQGCVRDTATSVAMAQVPGRAVAVAYDPEGRLVVQTHGPLALHVFDTGYDGAREGQLLRSFTLDGGYTLDAAQSLFHSDTGARVTCASCHPEGEDDGRVWNLEGVGARRTPTLRGGLLATAPFNWEGDAADLHVATQRTYAAQALGGSLAPAQLDAAVRWLDGLPAIRRAPQGDAARVAAGRAVFEDPAVGCAGCHAGPRLTNNENHDVGTGGAYQVPSLVDVAARGPWMHDGRARSLRDAVMLGEGHGAARHLDAERLSDLLRYLESL